MGFRGEAEGRDAAEEGSVDDLQLHPGQRLAEALVHAKAEGHVVACVAVDVETVGVGEGGGVPVADVGGKDRPLAGRDASERCVQTVILTANYSYIERFLAMRWWLYNS